MKVLVFDGVTERYGTVEALRGVQALPRPLISLGVSWKNIMYS